MNKFHLPLGILPPSFGRICDLIAAIEWGYYSNNKPKLNLTNTELNYLIGNIEWILPKTLKTKTVERIPFPNFDFLMDYLKLNLKVTSSDLKLNLYNFGVKASKYFSIASINSFDKYSNMFYRIKNRPNNLISFMDESFSNNISDALLNKGINLSNLILFYNRDGDYDFYQYGQQYHAIKNRNSDFDIFKYAINLLLDTGYSVVRVGRTRQKASLSRRGFYDYASSELVNSWNDFYLWSHAKAGISTGGGATHPGFLFKIPILFINFGDTLGTISKANYPFLFVYPKQFIKLNNNINRISTLDSFKKILFHTDPMTEFSLQTNQIRLMNNSNSKISECIFDFLESISLYNPDKWIRQDNINLYYDWNKNL